MSAIAATVFQTIGKTPLVKLNRCTSGLRATILAKLEFFSPTGSLKDRILFRMVEAAEERGDLKPGMTIIEATTGNTGIATAMVAAVKGYRCLVVMPEGMSLERRKMIGAYGAEIVLTPGGESDVDLCLKKMREIMEGESGRYWQVGQFENRDNVLAHYHTTGPEIWEQTKGEVDIFVAALGTGGTITGVGKFLKEKKAGVKIYAVEPAECPLLSKGMWGPHKIEGIGDGFIPPVLDVSILAGIVTVSSQESVELAKRLAIGEGIFCGISSGCNVAAALKLAQRLVETKVIVTMINDNGPRYFSTELCGEIVNLVVPDRGHPLDERTLSLLKRYQGGWEIID